jgi:hypothetical protein
MAEGNHPPMRFVADGHRRAREAMEPSIRAAVESEFAVQLKGASFWQRWRIRAAIEREIDRRIERMAPRHALY